MVLGFKDQFVDKILDGSKIHTIREDRHDRWHAGNQIQFATGVRTKKYNCFKEGVCASIQNIEIRYKYMSGLFKRIVLIDGQVITHGQLLDLAENDGFEKIDDFFKWFDKDFTGKVIHWTGYRYNAANII